MKMIETSKLFDRREFETLTEFLPIITIIGKDWLKENKETYDGAKLVRKKLSDLPSEAFEDENNLYVRTTPDRVNDLLKELETISGEEDIQRIKENFGTMTIKEVADQADQIIDFYHSIESFVRSERMKKLSQKVAVISENMATVFGEENQQTNES